YGWAGDWDIWFDTWGKQFEKETGIKLRYVSGGGLEMYAKIISEANAPKADVFLSSAGYLYQLSNKNLLEPINWKQISNAVNVDSRFKDQDVAVFGYDIYQIGYNTDFIKKQDVPKKWIDLANPKFRGKIIMRLPNSDLTAWIWFALKRSYGEEAAWKYLMDIYKNSSKWAGTPGDLVQGLASGEAWAGGASIGHVMLGRFQAGGPVASSVPEDGAIIMLNGLGIVKGAPHKAEAEKFIDFFLGKYVQNFIMNEKGTSLAVNRTVKLTNKNVEAVGLGGLDIDKVLERAFVPEWKYWTGLSEDGKRTRLEILLNEIDLRVKGMK
ncbi:MAG TPA: extracellular solute-binding protein, partial [Firmicutes bacterium]|nr:extracellular solute-binding protein [Bacillota bacterium]